MEPVINGITLPSDGIVRHEMTSATIGATIRHNGGANIKAITSGSMFKLDFFLISGDPDYANGTFDKVISTTNLKGAPEFQEIFHYNTETEFTVKLTIQLNVEDCWQTTYLCVNLTKDMGIYFETNNTNNINCFNIEAELTCKPGTILSA